MKIIGITGGVGTGKSKVLSYLQQEYNAYICEADHVAWDLQKPGEACYSEIVSCFGTEILNEDGTINRKYLGQIVFVDVTQLKKLNEIMHPAVKRAILSLIEVQRSQGCEMFVIEAALLLETKYDALCEETWYVYSGEQVRRERLKTSRAYTEGKIDRIMAAQLSEDYFREKCDRVIDNDGAFEETCRQIKEILG